MKSVYKVCVNVHNPAPQACNVNNRRWSEAEPAAGHNPKTCLPTGRHSPEGAELQILFSSCRAGVLAYPPPPVPLRSTDGYLRYTPAAFTCTQ